MLREGEAWARSLVHALVATSSAAGRPKATTASPHVLYNRGYRRVIVRLLVAM